MSVSQPPRPEGAGAPGAGEPGVGTEGPGDETTASARPAIVVHGEATPEQLAALVAVLSAASGGGDRASDDRVSTWAAHAAAMRHPVSHGPGAWRTSLRS